MKQDVSEGELERYDPAGLAHVRALVVEDEALVAMLVEDYLRELGILSVFVAGSFQAGMHEATNGSFDLAVLDLNLNGERSDAIADVLSERGVPFVFSTGHARGWLSGRHEARPFVSKPISFSAFRDAVLRAVSAGKAVADPGQPDGER